MSAPSASEAARAAESDLVANLKSGDEAAYATLVNAQAGRMLAVARRLLGSDADAQDAVQEAFLSAFKSIDRFRESSRLSTWLHRIVVNAALMKLRSRKRKPEVSIETLLPSFLEDGHHSAMPEEWKRGAQDMLESEETRAFVRGRIDSLPEDYRNVLLLRDIEELDTKETAELLGVTPNAVKIRLHRARLALRGLLDPHMRGDTSP